MAVIGGRVEAPRRSESQELEIAWGTALLALLEASINVGSYKRLRARMLAWIEANPGDPRNLMRDKRYQESFHALQRRIAARRLAYRRACDRYVLLDEATKEWHATAPTGYGKRLEPADIRRIAEVQEMYDELLTADEVRSVVMGEEL